MTLNPLYVITRHENIFKAIMFLNYFSTTLVEYAEMYGAKEIIICLQRL